MLSIVMDFITISIYGWRRQKKKEEEGRFPNLSVIGERSVQNHAFLGASSSSTPLTLLLRLN